MTCTNVPAVRARVCRRHNTRNVGSTTLRPKGQPRRSTTVSREDGAVDDIDPTSAESDRAGRLQRSQDLVHGRPRGPGEAGYVVLGDEQARSWAVIGVLVAQRDEYPRDAVPHGNEARFHELPAQPLHLLAEHADQELLEAGLAECRLEVCAREREHGQVLEGDDRGSASVIVAQQGHLAEVVTRAEHGERRVVAVFSHHAHGGVASLNEVEAPALVAGMHDRLLPAKATTPGPVEQLSTSTCLHRLQRVQERATRVGGAGRTCVGEAVQRHCPQDSSLWEGEGDLASRTMGGVMSDARSLSLALVCACGEVSPITARFCAECGRQLAAPTSSLPESAPAVVAARAVPPRPAVEGPVEQVVEERRRVTAVFADISGFTALASTLDTEELLGVIDPILETMARIVTRYDGWLEKFTGDALLALFGAPVSHEDDAVRALRAAEDMHAEVAALHDHPLAHGLALHVGITTGDVVARSITADGRAHYAVLGESVILAQRLESMAPAGETYVGSLTAALVGHRFAFDELGAVAVKGRPQPVEVFRFLGSRADAPTAATRPRMIGRSEDAATVTQALAAVRGGAGSVVGVLGPPGIGKTRLLDDARDQASRGGMLCVDIAGASYSRAAYRSLAPLVEAGLAARYPDETSAQGWLRRLEAEDTLPASAHHTSLLLGEGEQGYAIGDRLPEGVRRDLHRAAAAWLLDLASSREVVVTVDNLQWLERSSLELLAELAAETAGTHPVLFLLSGRPPLPPGGPVMTTTLRLEALTSTQVQELVVDELELAPDERLVDFVVERSRGVPLMVRETVRQLRSEGLLDVRDGHAHLIAGAHARQVPSTLETLLNARLDTLSAPSIALAVAAAAVGYVVPDGLLGLVVGQAPASLAPLLDELSSAEILSRGIDDDLHFSSPLVRDVLYARLTGRRRRALHRRIADALEDPRIASATAPAMLVSLLAEHRYLAGQFADALHWLHLAAERSRQVFAHDDAVVALVRAVEAARVADVDMVAPLLCDLADVRTELGEYDRAGDLYGQATALESSARSLAGQAASLRRSGSYADAEQLLRVALDTAITGDQRLVWRELSWVLSVSGDLAGALTAAAHGLTLDGDTDAVAGHLLCQMVRCETLLGRYDAAEGHLARAIDNLERAVDLVGLCTALRLQGSLLERTGALDEAAVTLQRGLELAERTGLAEEVGGCLINLGLVHGARSDHRKASDCYARAAVTFEQTGNRAGRAMAYGNRAYELLALEEIGAAQDLARRGLQLAVEVGNHMTAADIHHTLALISEGLADHAAALREAELAIGEFELAGMPEAAQESRELAGRVSGRTPGR
jgi:adenylate cyclase